MTPDAPAWQSADGAQPSPRAPDGERRPAGQPRPTWRAVALPAEHGGWGLTFEAVLLGLLVRASVAGAALGLAALLAFLARTPLKLALVDRRRHRRLERTLLAERFAVVELSLLAASVAIASLSSKWRWWVPLGLALPLFALELSFDVRSRGRRLLPELSGALGMGAVAAAIAVAGGALAATAMGLWLVLAARATASVPFARAQVRRLKHQSSTRRVADALQLAAGLVALVGVALGWVSWLGAVAIGALAVWNLVAMRQPVPSVKRLGFLQLVAGLAVVGVTAIGVHLG